MKGYTIFDINGEVVKEFWAKNDTHALLMALVEGMEQFKLARTGYKNVLLREVANVNNKAS